tara:strand:+ start:308 stop:1237 length:930 start_codon:yes stop_codon:yes gene_type:complete
MNDYTIIVPVYCNETSLNILYKEVEEKIFNKNPNLKGKIVFCDDRSTDNSYIILKNLQNKNPEIGLIRFTRNFGQTAGIFCCLEKFESKAYIIMSADLQDPVELINDFLYQHFNEGYHLVAGIRNTRNDGFISDLFSKVFYLIMKKLVFKDYPRTHFDYLLISKKMRDIMLALDDKNPFWQGQMIWSGLSRKFIPYERGKRIYGKSKYTFSKRVKYFIDGIFGFSFTPIRLITVFGIIISMISFIYAVYILIEKLFFGNHVEGWSTIVVLVLLFSGIQCLFLGIIGEYLWRTFSQSQKKPLYIIDETNI